MYKHGLCSVVTRGHMNKLHADLVSSLNPDMLWPWAATIPPLPSPCKWKKLRYARLPCQR